MHIEQEQHQLLRSIKRRDEQDLILRRFARIAADATDFNWLLGEAVRQAAQAFDTSFASAMWHRPSFADLLVVSGIGWREGVVGSAQLAVDMASPPGRTLQARRTIRVDDLRESKEFRYSSVLQEHGIVSVLATPIAVDEQAWGVIEIASSDVAAFDDRDARFLETFALILSMGARNIKNATTREKDADEIKQRLARAETLVKEANHRVKNYLQTVMALLSMKSEAVRTEHSREMLRAVMDHVTAISLAHDMLIFRRDESHVVRAAEYFGALCSNVERIFEGVRIESDLSDADLPVSRAVPLGLIVNELVTNAVKHVVRPRLGTSIRVVFHADPKRSEARVLVSDDGPGMAPPAQSASGLHLVEMLAGQLGGRLHVDSSAAGARVSVTFPLPG